MSKVLISDYIQEPNIETNILNDNLTTVANKDVEVILLWNTYANKEYIDSFPNLKAVIRYGVGYDNADLNYLKEKGIYLCNTPDYGTDEVSDTAIAMIMNIARGLTLYDSNAKNYFDTWQENTNKTIKRNSDYKLGIIGAGRIGGSVIVKANALKFDTYFYDPYLPYGYEKLLNTKRVESLDELLENMDILSINAPLTNETKNMIDKEFVSKMKKGSSLVNTARGGIVKDIDVFYEALKIGHLNSVAFDVLPYEPPKESKLITAWRANETWIDGRVIINPHTAYYSKKSFFEMRQKAALNAKRVIEGKKPINIVNGL